LTITELFKNNACKRSLKLSNNAGGSPAAESGSDTSVLGVNTTAVANDSNVVADPEIQAGAVMARKKSVSGTPTKRSAVDQVVDKENSQNKSTCITID
jgi:hypothetical protein